MCRDEVAVAKLTVRGFLVRLPIYSKTLLLLRGKYGVKMTERSRKLAESSGTTATFLLTKQADYHTDAHRVKVAVVGSGYAGVAIAIAILFKRLASELVLIDVDENLAKAEAEDIGHAAAFFGNPKIVGTKEYSLARDAAVCVIAASIRPENGQDERTAMEANLQIFKAVVPNVCKFAPNSVLVIVTSPVDILSYAAMKLSGFPPNRVIGLGTFLDSCRFQYLIAQKLGLSANSVQAIVIGENGTTSVPVWSAVSVMGIKLKDINKEIGQQNDPEGWSEVHDKVVGANEDLVGKKGHSNWAVGICVGEIVDAIVRNTRASMTVSTFVKGCRHGLEKDVFMSLPCVIGRNGVQSYIRQLYTTEEQDSTTKSCRHIYETQKPILDKLE